MSVDLRRLRAALLAAERPPPARPAPRAPAAREPGTSGESAALPAEAGGAGAGDVAAACEGWSARYPQLLPQTHVRAAALLRASLAARAAAGARDVAARASVAIVLAFSIEEEFEYAWQVSTPRGPQPAVAAEVAANERRFLRHLPRVLEDLDFDVAAPTAFTYAELLCAAPPRPRALAYAAAMLRALDRAGTRAPLAAEPARLADAVALAAATLDADLGGEAEAARPPPDLFEGAAAARAPAAAALLALADADASVARAARRCAAALSGAPSFSAALCAADGACRARAAAAAHPLTMRRMPPLGAPERELGAGAYGSVTMHTLENGEPAALKTVRGAGTVNDALLTAVLEVAALRLMAPHAHVVRLLGADAAEDGTVRELYEFVDGNLRAIIDAPAGARDAALRRRAGRALLEGVAHVHAYGLVHRDLKPENVLCSGDARVLKVADFGAAHARPPPGAEAPRLAPDVTTITYRAPEQLLRDSRTYGAAADMWAVGLMLAELEGGWPPQATVASADEEAEQLAAVFETLGTPPLLRERDDPDPPGARLEQRATRCLALDVWTRRPVMAARPLAADRAPPRKQRGAWRANGLKFVVDADLRALVDRLLAFDPDDRPSADDALACPWFRGAEEQRGGAKRPERGDEDEDERPRRAQAARLGAKLRAARARAQRGASLEWTAHDASRPTAAADEVA